MSFNLSYDKKHCNSVVDMSASKNTLEAEVSSALKKFYKAVNEYFSHGVSNYKSGYTFNFAFEMVSNSVDDNDPDAEAMLQFTSRREGPQDIHFHVCGGRDSKYVTSELIIPAYTYLLNKCSKLHYTAHESHYRRFGAPIVCVPNSEAIEIQCPGKDITYWVLEVESPKLNDEPDRGPSKPEPKGLEANDQSTRTKVFG